MPEVARGPLSAAAEGLREQRELPARARQGWRRGCPFFHDGNDPPTACSDFFDVGQDFLVLGPGRRHEDHRHPVIDEGNGTVLHLGRRHAFGVDVGDFLQLQGASMATGQWRPRPGTTSSPGRPRPKQSRECGLPVSTRAIRVGICSNSARTSCNASGARCRRRPIHAAISVEQRPVPRRLWWRPRRSLGRRASAPRHRPSRAMVEPTTFTTPRANAPRSRASRNPPRVSRFLQIGSRKSPRCLLPPPVSVPELAGVCRFCRDTTPMFNQLSAIMAACSAVPCPNSTTRRACTSCRVIGQATQDHFARRRSIRPRSERSRASGCS